MKVSCIIASYNRPRWIRQAIKSVADQTHKDHQLVIVDESDIFDINEAVKEFKLPAVEVRHYSVTPRQRAYQNRLSINLNIGLALATGDLLCFLADDDYLYPTWYESAVKFFTENPKIGAGYGKLVYSNTEHMEFLETPAPVNLRFFPGSVDDPFNKIDHNQGIHRKITPPLRWPENPDLIGGPDAYYYREVAKKHRFHAIDAWAAVKRVHPKNLQQSLNQYKQGSLGGARD